MITSRAVVIATVVGTVLQLAMVICGHTNSSIAAMFAVGGMSISLLAGLVYSKLATVRTSAGHAAGGAIAGGVCALIGIAVSCALGDVQPIILLVGTLSSTVTGAIGGWVGRFLFGSGPAATA